MAIQKQRDALVHKTFTLMIRVAIIFAIPAIAAYFIGKYLDTRFDIRPYGSLGVLAISFIGSWIVVIRMYLKIDRQFRELREQEESTDKEEAV